jgi:hypothetical protein
MGVSMLEVEKKRVDLRCLARGGFVGPDGGNAETPRRGGLLNRPRHGGK